MKDYKWCAIDAEGDVGNMGLLGVAFYSDILQSYITDHEQIKTELLLHAQQGYTFLAHNAQYDLAVIFWQLKIPMKAVYYNGRFNRGEWKYHHSKSMCQMWDTLALSGGLSLVRLGQALGLHKYNTPQALRGIDANKYDWFCDTHSKGECEECYALRDAEIVYRFIVDLQSVLHAWGVEPHRRISGLAMKVWRVMDQPESIEIKDRRIKALARNAYHGGRVETFKLGHINGLYTADVCSMYPSVMLTTAYPDPRKMMYLDEPSLAAVPLDKEGVADVDISIPSMYCPPLPYVHKGMLYYPIGRLRGYWTLRELRYAQTMGCTINRVYSVAFSTENLYPFTNFIGTLWAMRQEYERTNDPRSLFAKLLMNNLYGRLGMKEDLQRKDVTMCKPDSKFSEQDKTGWYTEDGRLFLTNERHQPHGNDWTNVMWAAQTTAEARVRLHTHLQAQGKSLVYCDTDSVFSTQPIIGMGEGLGSLRDETFYQQGIIAAPKLYAVQDVIGEWRAKAKGVPAKVALQFLRTGSADYQQPIKPLAQMQRKELAGTWVDVHKETQHSPHRRTPVDADILEKDYGFSDTVPAVIGPVP